MYARMFIVFAALIVAFNVSAATSPRAQRYQLSIQRGPLTSALQQLAEQTGLHVGTELSAAQAKARDYGPLEAHEVTADQAIKALLAGSELWYAWRGDALRVFHATTQRTHWSSGVSRATEAGESIRSLGGVKYDPGKCGDYPVGPFESTEPMTAEDFWLALIRPYCQVVRRPSTELQPGTIEGESAAGDIEHLFSIPAQSRLQALQRLAEQAAVSVDYVSSNLEEEQAAVAPILGVMSLSEALQLAMRDSVLRARWISPDRISVEPAYALVAHADMSRCDCNFGLPEWRGVQGAEVIVERSRIDARLASLAPDVVFDRRAIDATGASSVSELLDTLSQQAFSLPRGFQPNGAQYFQGRGFGAPYALILINGQRAYGSAADPMTNAFDLNVVPLTAVDHIVITLDQPSVHSGMDAFGGTVNIVLKDTLQEDALTLNTGFAAGGAKKHRATLATHAQWGEWETGLIIDHLTRGELVGSKRARWRNQDYTPRGGQDYRLPGVLPNVRAITGVLPEVGSNTAGFTRGADGLTPDADRINRESALAYMGIEPAQRRTSAYAFAHTESEDTQVSAGLLFGKQTASLRLFPVTVAGLTWGTSHFQNPFGRDVHIDTMLTGLPTRRHETESDLTRLTLDWHRSLDRWNVAGFAVAQRDRSQTWLANDVDSSILAQSLSNTGGVAPLNVLTERPGAGPVPEGLLVSDKPPPYRTEALQLGLTASGEPVSWQGGGLTLDLGVEYRKEAAVFDAHVGRRDREIKSTFIQARTALLGAADPSLPPRLEFTAGARKDFHSDVRDVSTWQSALRWRPHPSLALHGSFSTLFRPPSLYELYLPRFSYPSEVIDPRHDNEATAITLLTGGNPALEPSEGQSFDVGVAWNEDRWKTSIKYWQTQMRNRVSAALVPDLLNAREEVAERIGREDGTDRLLSLDITFGNFGAVYARGYDLSVQRAIPTRIGVLTPKLDITRTVDFRYRDRPAASAPLLDRAGIASVYGTVPSGRAVASLKLERGSLSFATYARYYTSYKDYSDVAGTVTSDRVADRAVLDMTLSKNINHYLTLSIGARNVLDRQPPFAQSGGWEGFDQTQADLLGREAFIEITGSL